MTFSLLETNIKSYVTFLILKIKDKNIEPKCQSASKYAFNLFAVIHWQSNILLFFSVVPLDASFYQYSELSRVILCQDVRISPQLVWFGLILRHLNHCRFFNSKSINIYIYIYIYIYIHEVHTISFQTFFVWELLLIVHTWNSSPPRSCLLYFKAIQFSISSSLMVKNRSISKQFSLA